MWYSRQTLNFPDEPPVSADAISLIKGLLCEPVARLTFDQIISHPTWFGKKEVFEKLNGYRNMPLCEDYDFTLRAVLNGYKISNIEINNY